MVPSASCCSSPLHHPRLAPPLSSTHPRTSPLFSPASSFFFRKPATSLRCRDRGSVQLSPHNGPYMASPPPSSSPALGPSRTATFPAISDWSARKSPHIPSSLTASLGAETSQALLTSGVPLLCGNRDKEISSVRRTSEASRKGPLPPVTFSRKASRRKRRTEAVAIDAQSAAGTLPAELDGLVVWPATHPAGRPPGHSLTVRHPDACGAASDGTPDVPSDVPVANWMGELQAAQELLERTWQLPSVTRDTEVEPEAAPRPARKPKTLKGLQSESTETGRGRSVSKGANEGVLTAEPSGVVQKPTEEEGESNASSKGDVTAAVRNVIKRQRGRKSMIQVGSKGETAAPVPGVWGKGRSPRLSKVGRVGDIQAEACDISKKARGWKGVSRVRSGTAVELEAAPEARKEKAETLEEAGGGSGTGSGRRRRPSFSLVGELGAKAEGGEWAEGGKAGDAMPRIQQGTEVGAPGLATGVPLQLTVASCDVVASKGGESEELSRAVADEVGRKGGESASRSRRQSSETGGRDGEAATPTRRRSTDFRSLVVRKVRSAFQSTKTGDTKPGSHSLNHSLEHPRSTMRCSQSGFSASGEALGSALDPSGLPQDAAGGAEPADWLNKGRVLVKFPGKEGMASKGQERRKSIEARRHSGEGPKLRKSVEVAKRVVVSGRGPARGRRLSLGSRVCGRQGQEQQEGERERGAMPTVASDPAAAAAAVAAGEGLAAESGESSPEQRVFASTRQREQRGVQRHLEDSDVDALVKGYGWKGHSLLEWDASKGLLSQEDEGKLLRMVESGRKLLAVRESLEKQLGREVTAEEWAAAAGLSRAWMERALQLHRAARNKLVMHNLGLVVSTAGLYRSLGHGVDFASLCQRGVKGLYEAVDRFTFDRPARFSTYATVCIRTVVTREIAASLHVRAPTYTTYKYRALSGKERELEGKLGRKATEKELASYTNTAVPQLRHIRHLFNARHASMHQEGGDGLMLGDLVEDSRRAWQDDVAAPDGHEQPLLASGYLPLRYALDDVIDTLKPKEAVVLRQRFGLDGYGVRSLRDIGKNLSISAEMVRKYEAQALAKLRLKERADLLHTKVSAYKE